MGVLKFFRNYCLFNRSPHSAGPLYWLCGVLCFGLGSAGVKLAQRPGRASGGAQEGAWGVLGGSLGVLGGAWGILGRSLGVLGGPGRVHGGPWGVPGGPLGGPWTVLGGPWGDPGRSQATFWVPRSDPDDKGAHSGGSRGGYRRVEKSPESIFLRSREAKCVYFHGFEHVHFVDFMWPLAAPGPPWGDFGRPRGLQGRSWGGPGGVLGGNDPPPGHSRGVPSDRVPTPGRSRGAFNVTNQRFGAVVVLP